jgi:hypothetical protein
MPQPLPTTDDRTRIRFTQLTAACFAGMEKN